MDARTLLRMLARPTPLARVFLWLPFVLLLTACTKKDETPAADATPDVTKPDAAELDLWAGVPALTEEPGDLAETIEPRPGPKKPKTVGERVELPFDPKTIEGGPPVPPGTALEVLRYGPEGAAGLVGAVRVAFNQPMVPLAAVETLKAKPIPLEITPKPPGKSRWLGTQVLVWEPEGRMPFSTTYEITVPAGVKATTGAELARPKSWTFSTPTLALESSSPYNGSSHIELEPTITLVFNQPVEKTALVGALELRGKGKSVALALAPTLATPAAGDEAIEWMEKRTVRLMAKTALLANTTYTLKLPAGVFGEGPDRSEAITTNFTTYPPLRISWPGCYGSPCWSTSGITLEATNQITEADIASKVHVEPSVDELSISAFWSGISIGGRFEGGKTYTVTVDAGVTDNYGQTLAAPFKQSIKLGPPYPSVSPMTQVQSPAVIERAGSAELKLRVAGLRDLELEARTLKIGDITNFLNAYPSGNELAWPGGVAAHTWSDKLDVSSSLKMQEDFAIDLRKALAPGGSLLWINARSEEVALHGWKQRMGYYNLFEITDLGIAAALDAKGGLIQVTRLSTGEPIAGAELSLVRDSAPSTPVWSGVTDAHGLATPTFSGSNYGSILVAKTADDTAFLRVNQSDLRGQWHYSGSEGSDEPRAFIYTDRTPYKPGDTIHVAGIIRKETRGPTGGVTMWARDLTAQYLVNDPRGIEVAKGETRIGKFGTFSMDVPTDADGGTGNYNLTVTVPGLLTSDHSFYHSIPVETYRTPEFKVGVVRNDSKPLVYGDTLLADVEGEYLHGAPLVGGAVAWSLTRSETGFNPPGDANREFRFGTAPDYGYGYGRGFGHGYEWGGGWGSFGARTLVTGTGTLDVRGKLAITKALLAIEPDPSVPAVVPVPGIKPEPEPEPAAATYTINATVTDENRQAIAGTGSFVVHPASLYVGLRSERKVLKAGESAALSAIAVDLDGNRVVGRDIALKVVRKETTRKAIEVDGAWRFEYETKEIESGTCALSSGNAPTSCDVTVGEAGQYVVRGSTQDDKGNAARSEMTLYVHGKDAVVWEDNEHRIDLVPDKDKYKPGDTAIVLLRAPFDDAHGFVLVEREGIAKQIPVHLRGGTHVVEIPVDATMIPNVTVSALLTRGRVTVPGVPSGQDLGRPAAATGRLELKVDDAEKRIVVELTPSADRVAPGSKLDLKIHARTAGGDTTKAAVAVMVVDEGVLSLMGHQTPDPLTFFHHERAANVWLFALQASVVAQELDIGGGLPAPATTPADGYGIGGLGLVGTGRGGGGKGEGTVSLRSAAAPPAPMEEAEPQAAPGAYAMADKSDRSRGDEAKMGAVFDPGAAMAQPVSLRDVFATTAYFNAEIETDALGNATVSIDMPENLTTFRIMAVAIDPEHADRFGNGEATVTVRKPIMVRPSLPRFANFGDSFEASVMVDNLSDEAQNILVGTRGLNVEITGSDEKFVEIPAGESKEVRFDMKTAEVGRMRLQFAVMSNAGRDATELAVPVHYPAVAKAFADYGMVDSTTQRLLEPPADALPDFGGLEVSMSSTALSGLEDAVKYLVDYPYECAEQTASRILPIFALGDIMQEFPIASTADKARRDALVADGIKRLFEKQNYDGGFGYWHAAESWPYLTNWVVLALLEGKKKGYAVDQDKLDRALAYVDNFVRHGHETRWGRYYDWTSRAFGLWLLSGEGQGKDLFGTVWAHQDDLPLYARAQLMTVAHRFGKTSERDAVRVDIDAAVVESTRAIHFKQRTSEADADGLSLLMHSDVQTDSIVMMALLETAPTEPMLPKIMTGIMADRDPRLGGRWGSTHANAWALLGASRYYDTVEGTEPNFTARIWIDDDFGGEHTFAGRSMDTIDQRIAMRTILGAAQREVTLEKDGPGKLYYRLGLRYAPADLVMPPEDQGFHVYREYTALPDAAGKLDVDAVKRTEDGGWIVKAGTDVRVTIHVVARDRASYVVIDDALPAGFEGQNPRFLTSGAAPSTASRTVGATHWWWPWWQFDHTDLRDDRMLLFADWMPAGVYSYSYTARATTIGNFHLPPIKAEAMYEPERFGHSASSQVRVVE